MKALVEKDILMKKQGEEMRKAPHFFYVHLSFFYFVENGSKKLIFRQLMGTQGNLGFFNQRKLS